MNNAQKEILDAVEIMIENAMKNMTHIYTGRVTASNTNTKSCDVTINGRSYTVAYYGNNPVLNTSYRVFVPNGNMSIAFIIIP